MKIYILADLEGISGIRKIEQVITAGATPDYNHGCKLMMLEINQAVAGVIEGGATEVIVCDTHGGGGQIKLEEMDPRAIYETPACKMMMPSLDASFGGVILLGHHAKAGTLNGFLDHTMDSSQWFEFRINDQVVGEIGFEAAWAGHFNVPVIMVSGDETTAHEARATLGEVETAVVKWGIGRNRAKCLSLPQAHEIVRKTCAQAVRRAASKAFKPFKPALPGTIQLTLYRSDYADEYASKLGVTRVDARTIRRQVECWLDVVKW